MYIYVPITINKAHNVHKVSEEGSSLSLTNFHLDAIEKEISILRDNL